MTRRKWAIVIAAVVIAIPVLGVGGYLGYAAFLAPTSATASPDSGSTEVSLDRPFTLHFSRATDGDSFSSNFHFSPTTEGRLVTGAPATIAAAASGARTAASGGRVSGDSDSFSYVPSGQWADHTVYTAILDTHKDAAGRQVTGGRWTFTTTTVPRILAVTNESGISLGDRAEVPVGTRISVTFNVAMDQGATQVLINGVPAPLTWAGDGLSAMLDTSKAAVGPLELSLAPGARDLARHAAQPGWKFVLSVVFKVSVHTTPLAFPALVQVPNDPGARDQSGLQSAGMVFEYATEGGITRLTALFSEVPDKVGPVRSGRLISLALTRHYGGMLFLSGTSEGTFGRLLADPVPTFFDTQGYFYRTIDHAPPDNLYINGDAIKRAEGSAPVAPRKLATGVPALAGDTATTFGVAEHRTTFDYDSATRTYTKTEDGHRMADAALGQPLRIGLVVVLHTTISTTSIIEDSNGARGLDFDLDSGGRAEYLYNGQQMSGRWSSDGRSAPLRFTDSQGHVIQGASGLTWIEVVS